MRESPQGFGALEEAYGELAVFGTQHLEEVGFNLVVTLAFLGRLEDALRRGENMLTFFEFGNFPRLELLSLVAVLLVLLERATEAREHLTSWRPPPLGRACPKHVFTPMPTPSY